MSTTLLVSYESDTKQQNNHRITLSAHLNPGVITECKSLVDLIKKNIIAHKMTTSHTSAKLKYIPKGDWLTSGQFWFNELVYWVLNNIQWKNHPQERKSLIRYQKSIGYLIYNMLPEIIPHNILPLAPDNITSPNDDKLSDTLTSMSHQLQLSLVMRGYFNPSGLYRTSFFRFMEDVVLYYEEYDVDNLPGLSEIDVQTLVVPGCNEIA